MARIVIHHNQTKEEVEEERLRENFALSYEAHIKKMFDLMRLGLMLRIDKGPFKKQINIRKGDLLESERKGIIAPEMIKRVQLN